MTGRSSVDSAERALIDRAAAGDREARRALFERHREAAYRTALRITAREEDALDVVQDAFIRAFERLAEFQRDSGFRTWLLRIVVNRALDVLRARKVRATAPLDDGRGLAEAQFLRHDDEGRPEVQFARGELAARVRAAVATLPPEQRAVLALYATGEMTYGEIADALGIPIGTVMSRLYHARRRLFELLPDLAPVLERVPRGQSRKTENCAGASGVKQIGGCPGGEPAGPDVP
jgi:RNA polymerase sigma-70 factor (ECF subfamily)